MDRNFTFKLLNLRTNKIKSFVARGRSMNEAISTAYVEAHSLRNHSKDSWKIISAVDNELYDNFQG